jgi:hypothetical protein
LCSRLFDTQIIGYLSVADFEKIIKRFRIAQLKASKIVNSQIATTSSNPESDIFGGAALLESLIKITVTYLTFTVGSLHEKDHAKAPTFNKVYWMIAYLNSSFLMAIEPQR